MTRPRILIVNDESTMRAFLRFNLKVRGYEVLDTIGREDILTVIDNERPDLVILDLMVRGVDGFELCKKICTSGNTSIIALNMRGGEADLRRCLTMGVDDYLGKPFGVEELMARIRAVLRYRRFMIPVEAIQSEWSKI